jgi:hypothetical protein
LCKIPRGIYKPKKLLDGSFGLAIGLLLIKKDGVR